jgi:hypothetical protein
MSKKSEKFLLYHIVYSLLYSPISNVVRESAFRLQKQISLIRLLPQRHTLNWLVLPHTIGSLKKILDEDVSFAIKLVL